jgi:hypothetical protein
MKPLYQNTIKKCPIKKALSTYVNNYKFNYINQNSKQDNNNLHSNKPRNQKKNSVRSVKFEDKHQINLSELNLPNIIISNKREKNDKSNNNTGIKSMNINLFKSKKINIDLTNINKDNESDNNLNNKFNDMKSLSSKNEKYKTMKKNPNLTKKPNSKKYYALIIKKEMAKTSRSNPKLSKEMPIINNQTKKLSLQEARYENKLKYDKIIIGKSELNSAECFLNDYKKMKSKDSIKSKRGLKKLRDINNTFLLQNKPGEIDDSSPSTSRQK